jgi:hypothetical protein
MADVTETNEIREIVRAVSAIIPARKPAGEACCSSAALDVCCESSSKKVCCGEPAADSTTAPRSCACEPGESGP